MVGEIGERSGSCGQVSRFCSAFRGRFKFRKSSKAYGDRSSKESDSSQPKANVSSTVNDPVLEENITKAAEQIPAHEVPVEVGRLVAEFNNVGLQKKSSKFEQYSGATSISLNYADLVVFEGVVSESHQVKVSTGLDLVGTSHSVVVD
ncbi:hypothetical protein ACOSQ4_002117 [Xanthoceras sorbifolium]